MLSEHTLVGMMEGYLLTGRYGFFHTYEAFAHVIASMFNQHAKWLESCNLHAPWRAPIGPWNCLISSTVWRQDHNGFTHQDPGFIDLAGNKSGEVVRVYLPPDANCLLAVAEEALQENNVCNIIVSDKQKHLQYMTLEQARAHVAKGISIVSWASNDDQGDAPDEPDVVMACAGDIPSKETLAAVEILRHEIPTLRIRVLNVVKLFALTEPNEHPHGLSDRDFDTLFTSDRPVIFNFHGYPWLIHRLTYRRTNHANIHVRGYKEKGNINTPLELAMNNQIDRFNLVIDVIDRVPVPALAGRPCQGADEGGDSQPSRLRPHPWHRFAGGHRLALDAAGQRRLMQAAPSAAAAGPGGVLVLNAGSSSLKACVITPSGERLWSDQRSWSLADPGAGGQEGSLEATLEGWLPEALAPWLAHLSLAGHRVVHGGERFTAPVRLDAEVLEVLEGLVPLAPLHNGPALRVMRWLGRCLPDLEQWACFDTAFHSTLPSAAHTYAIPAPWRARGLRRFGFHGLNHQHVAETVARRLERHGRPRLAAADQLPPRGRLLPVRHPGGAQHRHHHGLHPDGRAGDGHPQRLARSRAAAAPAPLWSHGRRPRPRPQPAERPSGPVGAERRHAGAAPGRRRGPPGSPARHRCLSPPAAAGHRGDGRLPGRGGCDRPQRRHR